MPDFPEEEENREKDFVIARSPLLRAFLDESYFLDYDKWSSTLIEVYRPIIDIMVETLGEERLNSDYSKFNLAGERSHVFCENITGEQSLYFLSLLVSLGFEVGDKDQAGIFYGDIFERMVALGVVENSGDSTDFTLSTIYAGVEMKEGCLNDLPKALRNYRTINDF